MFELPSSRTSCTRLPQEKFLPNSRLFKEALAFLHFKKEQQEQKQTPPGSSNADSKDKPAAPLTPDGYVQSKISKHQQAVCCRNVDCSREGQGKGPKSRHANLCIPRLWSFHSQPCKWRTNKLNARWLT